MIPAYVFHAVSIAVSILLIPLFLHHLDSSQYALWLVFTVFGGMTLHLQNAIQNASVKEISRGVHLHGDLVQAIQRMRSAYAGLTLFVAFPFFGLGLIYLNLTGYGIYTLEWCIFIMSYVLVYAFAPNFSLLLGSDRVAKCNYINTLTRMLYLLAAFYFLEHGFSVLGICISFAISSLLGVALSSIATRKDINPAWKWSINPNFIGYGFFALAAFYLYSGSILVAATRFPLETIAAYGLGIQISILLVALSLAPLQVWLARLVRTIGSGSEKKELQRSLIAINCVYISGSVLLFVFGGDLLVLVGSSIPLLDRIDLVLLAFAVELNIAILINFLMSKGNYQFVKPYVLISVAGFAAGIVAVYITNNIYGFVVAPLCFQSILSLPWMARIIFAELSVHSST